MTLDDADLDQRIVWVLARSAGLDEHHRRCLRQCRHRVPLGPDETELLDRQRWTTRIELANAIFA